LLKDQLHNVRSSLFKRYDGDVEVEISGVGRTQGRDEGLRRHAM